jgi:hypothetical protein
MTDGGTREAAILRVEEPALHVIDDRLEHRMTRPLTIRTVPT